MIYKERCQSSQDYLVSHGHNFSMDTCKIELSCIFSQPFSPCQQNHGNTFQDSQAPCLLSSWIKDTSCSFLFSVQSPPCHKGSVLVMLTASDPPLGTVMAIHTAPVQMYSLTYVASSLLCSLFLKDNLVTSISQDVQLPPNVPFLLLLHIPLFFHLPTLTPPVNFQGQIRMG